MVADPGDLGDRIAVGSVDPTGPGGGLGIGDGTRARPVAISQNIRAISGYACCLGKAGGKGVLTGGIDWIVTAAANKLRR